MKLFKALLTLAVVAALAVAVAPTYAADEAKDVTLSGEPVDMVCYLGGKSGEGHASCATACATKGNPIGLLVKDGGKSTLYLVLGGGGKAAKDVLGGHMGKVVKVTGQASKKDGLNILVATSAS